VYPMELRTRKVIHRCLFSDGRGTCKRTRVYDRGEFYHVRQAQPRSPRRMASQRYTTIEPSELREARWQEKHRHPSPTRRPSPARSRSFSCRVPIFRRPEPSDRQTWHERRGRQTSPRPIVIDFPEVEERRPRETRPASPRVQYISPRTGRSPISTDSERANDADDFTRQARSRQQSRGPRPPRERTPVTEREPARRGLNRVVDIHNDPPASQDKDRRSAERRQVRFSSDVEYEKNVNSIRARERSGFHQGKSVDARPPTHRGYPGKNGFARDAENRSNKASHSRDTSPHPRAHSPYPGRERQRHQETNRYRPRIIQDGSRILSEAGERILAEGWERHQRGNPRPDVELRTHRRGFNGRSGRLRFFHWGEESKDDRRHKERWS
jgi:peptidylprolyl isomerase